MTVDQCTECKGMFLDRGELEQLVAAEATWRQHAGPGPGPGDDRPRYTSRDDEHGYRQRYDKKRRRRSFLEGLFED